MRRNRLILLVVGVAVSFLRLRPAQRLPERRGRLQDDVLEE